MTVRVAGVCSLIVAAATAAAASAANPGPVPVNPGGPGMPATTATLSSTKAGAKPVALTLKVHYEMVCGQPGLGKAIVSLPDAAAVPTSIDTASVLVNGKPAPMVSTAGHDVSISLPLHHGVTCMVVGPGTLTLTFMRRAGLGNPTKPGTYTIRVQRRTQTFRATVQISA